MDRWRGFNPWTPRCPALLLACAAFTTLVSLPVQAVEMASSVPYVPGTSPELRVGHLTIYGGSYYGYVYARCGVWVCGRVVCLGTTGFLTPKRHKDAVGAGLFEAKPKEDRCMTRQAFALTRIAPRAQDEPPSGSC